MFVRIGTLASNPLKKNGDNGVFGVSCIIYYSNT